MTKKEEQRKEILDMTRAFLESGGEIEEVLHGATGDKHIKMWGSSSLENRKVKTR